MSQDREIESFETAVYEEGLDDELNEELSDAEFDEIIGADKESDTDYIETIEDYEDTEEDNEKKKLYLKNKKKKRKKKRREPGPEEDTGNKEEIQTNDDLFYSADAIYQDMDLIKEQKREEHSPFFVPDIFGGDIKDEYESFNKIGTESKMTDHMHQYKDLQGQIAYLDYSKAGKLEGPFNIGQEVFSKKTPLEESVNRTFSDTLAPEGLYKSLLPVADRCDKYSSYEDKSIIQKKDTPLKYRTGNSNFNKTGNPSMEKSSIISINGKMPNWEIEKAYYSENSSFTAKTTDEYFHLGLSQKIPAVDKTEYKPVFVSGNGIINTGVIEKTAKGSPNGKVLLNTKSADEISIYENTIRESAFEEDIYEKIRYTQSSKYEQRTFKESGNGIYTELVSNSMRNALYSSYMYIEGESQENDIKNGQQEIQKYRLVARDVMYLTGLKEASVKSIDKMNQAESSYFAASAVRAEKAIAQGKIKTEDLLLSKIELKTKMDEAGISASERWGIVKNREKIRNAMVMNTVIEDYVNNGGIVRTDGNRLKDLTKKTRKLHSKDDLYNKYDYYNSGMLNNRALQSYFEKHSDHFLKSNNPVLMNEKDLKRLLKNSDKYRLSQKDICAVKHLLYTKSRTKVKRGIKGLRSKAYVIERNLRSIDSASSEGLRKTIEIVDGVRISRAFLKLSVKGSLTTVKIIGKIPPVRYAVKEVKKGTGFILSKQKRAFEEAAVNINSSANIGGQKLAGIGKKSLKRTFSARVKKPKRKGPLLKNSRFLEKAADAGYKVKTAGKTVAKGARTIKRVSKTTKRIITMPVNVALKPFRIVFKAYGSFIETCYAILKFIFVPLFIAVITYAILLIISVIVMSMGNVSYEAEHSLILSEAIKEHIKDLQERSQLKYDKALEMAEGLPEHDFEHIDEEGLYPDEAYFGVRLYHYGSPNGRDDPYANLYHNDEDGEADNGYHIYFIDSNGNVIGNNTTNIKDVLCLSTVINGNSWDIDLPRSDKDVMETVDYLWDVMNPEASYTVSELYHKEGSDLFPYIDGKTYKAGEPAYYCTDKTFYDDYENALDEGVNFYDEPEPSTYDNDHPGCETDYESYNADYDTWTD
ncbi:MAG: hypothetical protein K6B41_03855, partial [Butyrivibrio sp.]|nr:hypothetical protein [Butyrivibrio sp.]